MEGEEIWRAEGPGDRWACVSGGGHPSYLVRATRVDDDESPTGTSIDVDALAWDGERLSECGEGGLFWGYADEAEALLDVGPSVAPYGRPGAGESWTAMPRAAAEAALRGEWREMHGLAIEACRRAGTPGAERVMACARVLDLEHALAAAGVAGRAAARAGAARAKEAHGL